MKFRVIVESRAAADIAAYGHWIVDQGSPSNAEQWLDGIEEAIRSLELLPERCRLAPESAALRIDIRQLIFKSHRVLFTVSGRTVHVLHVRHSARQPMTPEEPDTTP
jgi:plasmid stabilization system protein ParE